MYLARAKKIAANRAQVNEDQVELIVGCVCCYVGTNA